MNIKASGRSALIVAAGLWLGLAGPMRATDSAAEPAGHAVHTENAATSVNHGKYSKHRSHKHHVAHSRKSHKTASKEADAQADKTASATQDGDKQLSLPPAVANASANAEMPGATIDAPKTEADALANNAGKTLATTQAKFANPQVDAAPATASAAEIVAADELNEVDRALTDDKQPAPILAMASLDTPTSASSADITTGQAVANEDTWNQASLIGKIFIAFGGLLTFASAARMFMA